jgi:hypothetical protein
VLCEITRGRKMKLVELEKVVSTHSGVFQCSGRGGDKTVSKIINFEHRFEPPASISEAPDVGMLKEFYSTFSSLTLYLHKESEDAAFYIASPEEWGSLFEDFSSWIDALDEEEQEELLPEWIDNFITIGEIPYSGNYLLMPTTGKMSGHVFEFEHDGFEFNDHALNINDFVVKALKPDSKLLTNMASHMTFTESGEKKQWWLEEMRDNNGRVVRTEA